MDQLEDVAGPLIESVFKKHANWQMPATHPEVLCALNQKFADLKRGSAPKIEPKMEAPASKARELSPAAPTD